MAKAGHNSINQESAIRWTNEVLRVYAELDAAKIEHMNRCRVIRERLPDLMEAAKEAGLPIKAFKAHIKVERAKIAYERAIENATPEDDEDREAFDYFREIGEDGDLFHAAVKAKDSSSGDDEKDVRPRHLIQAEKDRNAEAAAYNSALLEGGISGLPGADTQEA